MENFSQVKNNCMECYNTIYNTTPLMLFGYGKELQKADFSNFRLNFTVESEEEVRRSLRFMRLYFMREEKTSQMCTRGSIPMVIIKEE